MIPKLTFPCASFLTGLACLAACGTASPPATPHNPAAATEIDQITAASQNAPPLVPKTESAPPAAPVTEPSEPAPPLPASPEEVRFLFRPTGGPLSAYDFPEPADQALLVVYPGVAPGSAVPVVVGFHGQPQRGRSPRDYAFPTVVRATVDRLVAEGALPPLVLVLPSFRFEGRNWPGLKPAELKKKIDSLLAERGLSASEYLVFGHSGAAGCGGDGLNQAHELTPSAVAFFDTCLGPGFGDELKVLEAHGISTLVVHSVETAGLKPRRRPEYQADFDFGQVYAPLGLAPTTCPERHPGQRLRDIPHRCSASASGAIRAFVVDTGEGEAAHEAALPVGLSFFLTERLGPAPASK